MRTITTFLFLFLFSQSIQSQSVNVPLDYRGYDFLERMEAKGVLLDLRYGTRPFTRERFAHCIQEIDTWVQDHPGQLSRVEMDQLNRLKGDFCDELSDSNIEIDNKEREPHFYSASGSHGKIHLEALLGGSVTLRDEHAEKSEREIYSPYYGAILRGNLWGVGIYSDDRIVTEWGSRTYVQHYQASMGYPQNTEKDGSRATWDTSDSYFSFSLKKFRFQIGRDGLKWGPSKWGGLMFSGLAPSFDMIKLTIPIGSALFTWAHGSLRSDFSNKWISAHRFEFSPCRGLAVGLSENVVYGSRGMEIAYLNPLLPYLVAEHTLGDRDNVSMGFDVSYTRIRNLKLYVDFFIDDLFAPWDIFSDYYGNKLAFTAGGLWVDPLRLDNSDFRWEYTRIEPYVYTHQDTVNVYENYNIGIGHYLQPNSDEIRMEWRKRFSLKCMSALYFQSSRHGSGDRRTPHLDEDSDKKQFLDGVVESMRRVGMEIEYEILRDLWVRLEFADVQDRNAGHDSGKDRNWHEVVLNVTMNW